MKVFLSHARKDVELARRLADSLERAGYSAWIAERDIDPGDNWATKVGEALDDSQLMVVLLTPGAINSDSSLRRDIEFAIGSRKFERRIFSVFVGPTLQAGKDLPWILLKLPHEQAASAREFDDVVGEIQSAYPACA